MVILSNLGRVEDQSTLELAPDVENARQNPFDDDGASIQEDNVSSGSDPTESTIITVASNTNSVRRR
jgi:hypothetical protein